MKTKTLAFLLSMLLVSLTTRGETLQKICHSSCSGPMASATPWLDSKGQAKVFEFRGDLAACSHPPLIFFNPEGKDLLSIPEMPLDPKDPVQGARFKDLHEKREALLKGLTRGKANFCPSK